MHRTRHRRLFVDQQILALNAGGLPAVDAAEAKWWTTELQPVVLDTCLQLHGGYGYMEEYPIAAGLAGRTSADHLRRHARRS